MTIDDRANEGKWGDAALSDRINHRHNIDYNDVKEVEDSFQTGKETELRHHQTLSDGQLNRESSIKTGIDGRTNRPLILSSAAFDARQRPFQPTSKFAQGFRCGPIQMI
jgi:hypothetical protein